jgi:hypothetical protein
VILGLLVRYGTARYPRGTEDGIAAFRAFAGVRPHRLVVVDNAIAPDTRRPLGDGVELRGGDNAVREFTAWDAALRDQLDALRADDVVVLATDALRQADADHLDAIARDAADLVAEWPVAYGHLDAFPHPIVVRGLPLASWVRSSFVAVNVAVLRSVLPLAAIGRADLFHDLDDPMSLKEFIVPPSYRDLLLDWLRGRELAGGHRYHAGRELHERSVEDFQTKAACIVNEHLLSARLVARGIRLVDFEWWARSAVSVNRELADTAEQLAWRGR